MKNSICQLFHIRYPIIQGGMVWVSGAKLAAAVSEAGGLGLIGAGSMKPDLLKSHIQKAQTLTSKPIGVNVPLLYKDAEAQLKTALDLGIKIFFTSAGGPKLFTSYLKSQGATVVHVTSSPELAKKCEDAGVDAVVAEGFEAGGHNGRDEITTMCLIPQVAQSVSIPVIAAGGIADARTMAAAMILGAEGVQMGTRFLFSQESSAHDHFKNLLKEAKPNSTKLVMKATVPVRLLENQFSQEIQQIEKNFAQEELVQQLNLHLGKGRAKLGMLDGDLIQGELEVGQIISLINKNPDKQIPTVDQIINQIMSDYQKLSLPTF